MPQTLTKPVTVLLFLLTFNDVPAQPALMDRLAEDAVVRLDWRPQNDNVRVSIEICLTNTCDQFVASDPNLQQFLRFVDVYVVFASHYGDLRSARGGRVPPIPYIASRLGEITADDVLVSGCSSDFTVESVSCAVQSLAADLGIEKYFVRYDEGRHVVPQPRWVVTDLSAENIKSNLRWSSSFGLPIPAGLGEN